LVFRTLIAGFLIQPKKQLGKFVLEIEWIFHKLRKLKPSPGKLASGKIG
jgi:hypothetical protein